MRHVALIIGLLLLPAVAQARDLRPFITRDAARCARAWQKQDVNSIAAFFPPGVIRQIGGRAALIREIQAQLEGARRFGVDRLQISPGAPPNPTPVGRWLTCLLPLSVVLHTALADMTQETHALGLSSDQGAHWYFVPLYQVTPAELAAWFPEFHGQLIIPADPPPQISFGS